MTSDTTSRHDTPFHAGELDAQRRAGVEHIARSAGSFIRDRMPEQHREFFSALPFVVIAAGDERGRPWVTVLEGQEGFIASPDPRTLTIAATLADHDPLAEAIGAGTEIGMLGIELATRRRNRANGRMRPEGDAFVVEVSQSFGNCPQYIREREWRRVEPSPAGARVSHRLEASQRARIASADTFFIGTGVSADADAAPGGESPARGYDASHRGGEPGFVRVLDERTLQIPDYAGNNFFNTLGNLLRDPRVGLLFVDFETGGMLQLTGRAKIDWAPQASHDPHAQRLIEVTVERVVDRPAALVLRWHRQDEAPLRLEVIDKVAESDRITSFYLADADGGRLPPFAAGQHLAVELAIPDRPGRVGRSYSLSGSPYAERYRLSVKREDNGLASRFLHDRLEVGDYISARPPAGAFVVPPSRESLVLVSAGVGITPMLAMLHQVVAENADRPVWFVHGTQHGGTHAFRAEVEALVAASDANASRIHSRICSRIYYSAPRAEDQAGVDYQAQGRITAGDLVALGAGPKARYLLCGPAGFLAELSEGLEAEGIGAERIDFETFGPAG